MKAPFPYRACLALGMLSGVLAAASCRKPEPPEPDPLPIEAGILVLNEGNFQAGNASLSFIDAEGQVHADVFKDATQRPLGDVAQSMNILGGDLYLVVNNSGKLEKLQLPLLEESCALSGLHSPRHLLSISTQKAYLSDLYSRSIQVINPSTCSLIRSIPAGGWTEEMLLHNGKAYAAQTGTDKLLIIDTTTDQLLDSIAIGTAPVSLRLDANGHLWVLCDGGLGPEPAVLAQFDVDADTVLQSFTFSDPAAFPADLRLNPAGDTLYWIDGGIWRMEIQASALPSQPWLPDNGMNFYALEIDANTGMLYVTDAKDFVQKGSLLRYSPAGVELQRYAVGVNPGAVLVVP